MAVAMPDESPPPETGTRTLLTSGRSSAISSPAVPWPAMMRRSSYGSIITMPRCATRSSATWCRSSELGPVKTISAPSRRTPSTLTCGAASGITITAGAPSSRAARATAWAWLPDE